MSAVDAPAISWRRRACRQAHAAGIFRLLAAGRRWPGVLVLCYHGVRADVVPPPGLSFAGLHVPMAHLAEHLEAARQLCVPVSLDQIVTSFASGHPLPARAIHFSFDDGYRSVLTRALPLLERYDVPASVFVCRAPAEQRTLYWYDAMARECGDDVVVSLRDAGRADWPAIVAGWSRPAAADDELAVMEPEEIARLSAHPLVAIGSHTDTHLPLAQLPPAAQESEIAAAIDALAAWTGQRPSVFAYPVGRPGHDFDDGTMRAARAAGVTLAFTTAPGWCSPSGPALEQPRFVMVDGVDGADLAYRLAWHWRH